MAAPAKQTSRWGSFLQQALDGVESRLDNILVGEGPPDTAAGSVVVGTTASARLENGPLRTLSNTGATGDRLQERLVRAVAAKRYAASKADSFVSSSNFPSRTGSPVLNADTPRRSMDNSSLGSEDAFGDKKQRSLDGEMLQSQTTDLENTDILNERAQDFVNDVTPKIVRDESPRPSMESTPSVAPRLSVEFPLLAENQAATAHASNAMSGDIMIERSPNPRTENGTQVKRQQSDEEISDLQRQEEIYGYIERIDALQAKLLYFTRKSAESARKTAVTSSTSAEKKLAEKDEKIALLMEEGQKLSKTELKHMTIIKKLRAKAVDVEKENADSKKRLEKADKEKALILERLNRSEAAEKVSIERQKMIAQLQKDNETLKVEKEAKDSNITELKAQLLESVKQTNADEVMAVQELVVLERRRISELENDLSLLRNEKELAASRAKAQLEELRAKIEREAERSRVAEVEMRAEQQMLESRLEVMRTRAEEVSSGSTGDTQAKFLRQIETLQTQYAIANENWQGIEASLTARATNLEKERDGASRRETEIRRKAREVTSKAKQNEEELEDTRSKLAALELELTGQKLEVERLLRSVSKSESATLEAKKAFEQEMQAWKAEVHQHTDDDRTKWQEEHVLYGSLGVGEEYSRALTHEGLTADLLGLQNSQSRNPARSIASELPILDGRATRKSSAQRMRSSGEVTPQRQNSGQSFTNEEEFESPLLHAGDQDTYFEHVLSPSSTNQTMQDVISVSTAGAGPSVQLVERMSAAVRRLESEKVSTKEEVRRLLAQRDEARAQTVKLLQEVELKRNLDGRIQGLEEENSKINARYQTTLEMLGEKSELVEELKADVQDVKDMYRELVERTIK